MMDSADRQFPGAVWSFSIGWGCDKLLTAADLAPVAVRAGGGAFARHHGVQRQRRPRRAGMQRRDRTGRLRPARTTSGWTRVASLPEMTDVGGTTLSTDQRGGWLAEQAWFDVPLSHGTGGGVSALFDRPDWQRGVMPGQDQDRRLTPDVAAVADAFTGGQDRVRPTCSSAVAPRKRPRSGPGMAAVMNQYLLGQRWTAARRPQPAAVSNGGVAAAAVVPGRDPGR